MMDGQNIPYVELHKPYRIVGALDLGKDHVIRCFRIMPCDFADIKFVQAAALLSQTGMHVSEV